MLDFFAAYSNVPGAQDTFKIFSLVHIVYFVVIFAAVIFAAVKFDNKQRAAKQKLIHILANIPLAIYLIDLGISLLFFSENGINLHKMPFNFCAMISIFIPIVQFNPHFKYIKKVVINIATVSAFLWLLCPITLVGIDKPFSYGAMEAFVYHGTIFAWGFLCLALGEVGISIRKIWKDFAGIAVIILWLNIGSLIFGGRIWIFLNKNSEQLSIYGEGISAIIAFALFIGCMLLYAVYYLVRRLSKQKRHKKHKHRSERTYHLPIKSAKQKAMSFADNEIE